MRNRTVIVVVLALIQLALGGCATQTPNYFGPGVLTGSGETCLSGSQSLDARTSALMQARRDLYDRLMKHNIDSETTIGDVVAKDPKAEEKMWGLVRKARIIEEENISDGKYRIDLEVDLVTAQNLLK